MTQTKDVVVELEEELARLTDEERRSRIGIDVLNWLDWLLVPVDLMFDCR